MVHLLLLSHVTTAAGAGPEPGGNQTETQALGQSSAAFPEPPAKDRITSGTAHTQNVVPVKRNSITVVQATGSSCWIQECFLTAGKYSTCSNQTVYIFVCE